MSMSTKININGTDVATLTSTNREAVLKTASSYVANDISVSLEGNESGEIQNIDMGRVLLDYTERAISDSALIDAIFNLDITKPICFTNFSKKPDYDTDIDYTTTSLQSFVYFNGVNYIQEIRIFNYHNYAVTIQSLGGSSIFRSAFAEYVGTTIPQNEELTLIHTFSTTNPYSSASIACRMNMSNGVTYTARFNGHEEYKFANLVAYCIDNNDSSSGYRKFFASVPGSTDILQINVTSSNIKYQLVDESQTTQTYIDMCKFTFKTDDRASTSALGAKLATQIRNANAKKPIILYDFRMLDEENDSTNICVLETVESTVVGSVVTDRICQGTMSFKGLTYLLNITVDSSNIQSYYVFTEDKIGLVSFGGLTVTTEEKSNRTVSYFNTIIPNLFKAGENYKTVGGERVGIPSILYGFKFISTSDSRNNHAIMQYAGVQGSVSAEYYTERIKFNCDFVSNQSGSEGVYNIYIIAERGTNIQVTRDSTVDSGTWIGWKIGETNIFTRNYGGQSGYDIGNTFYSSKASANNIGVVTESIGSGATNMKGNFGQIVFKADTLSLLIPDSIAYTTTAPTSDNTDGGLKWVVLSSAPETKYNGYIYWIAGTST